MEELANELIEYIQRQIENEADRHYSRFIFKADYPGQTHYEKYERIYGGTEVELINKLKELCNDR